MTGNTNGILTVSGVEVEESTIIGFVLHYPRHRINRGRENKEHPSFLKGSSEVV